MRMQMKFALLTILCLLTAFAAAETKPVVVFIATGGTIAMKIDPVKHAPVPAISGRPAGHGAGRLEVRHRRGEERFQRAVGLHGPGALDGAHS